MLSIRHIYMYYIIIISVVAAAVLAVLFYGATLLVLMVRLFLHGSSFYLCCAVHCCPRGRLSPIEGEEVVMLLLLVLPLLEPAVRSLRRPLFGERRRCYAACFETVIPPPESQ